MADREAVQIDTHTPSGGIRGTATGWVDHRGKPLRFAHTYLKDGGPAEKVSLKMPASVSLAEMRVLAERMLEFCDAVERAVAR